MHFRLGDYRNASHMHLILPLEYYINSISYLLHSTSLTESDLRILCFYEGHNYDLYVCMLACSCTIRAFIVYICMHLLHKYIYSYTTIFTNILMCMCMCICILYNTIPYRIRAGVRHNRASTSTTHHLPLY